MMEHEETRRELLSARREELLTVKEFAYVFRRHPEYVRELCRRGRQPGARRIGGRWYVDLVIAVRASGTAQPAA